MKRDEDKSEFKRLYESYLPYHRGPTLWDKTAAMVLVDAIGEFFDAFAAPMDGHFPEFDVWWAAVLKEDKR